MLQTGSYLPLWLLRRFVKKILISAALTLAVVGSWAFHPKATKSTDYMMLIGTATFASSSPKVEVTVIEPSGRANTTSVDGFGAITRSVTESLTLLHQTELKKLNELKGQGWTIAHINAQTICQPSILKTTYVLDR